MKEPLVLLPGFMADPRVFLPQILSFAPERPVMVLQPGAEDSVERMSQAMIPGLPPRFALLGHGLGGDIAIDILRRQPDRVSRIALIANDPLPEAKPASDARDTRIVRARAGRMAEALAAELPADTLADLPWRPEILSLIQEMGEALGLDSYIRQTRAMQRRPDQQRTLRHVKVPALILGGRFDRLVPVRRLEFLAGLMPFARVAVIEDAGHLPQIEQPDAVNAHLRDFLAGPLLLR